MIAKSDLVILVVSSTLLGVAIYRWDQNTRNVDTSTVLANTTVSATGTSGSTTSSDLDQPLATTSVNASTSNAAAGNGVIGNTTTTQYVEPQTLTPTSVVIEEAPQAETIAAYSVYTVRSGDSLSEIAARYNTTVNELRDINGISGSTIFIGQEIRYPNN